MAVPALTIPFLLVYSPIFLGLEWSAEEFTLKIMFVVIGFAFYLIGSEGFLTEKIGIWNRMLLVISALVIFSSGLKIEFVFLAIFLSLIALRQEIVLIFKRKRT